MRVVLDAEANGLLYEDGDSPIATLIYCICWIDVDSGESGSITDYNMMRYFLTRRVTVVIGHNLIRYDIPLFEKILGINLSHLRQIDTLAGSWYLYPERKEHGLGAWGEEFAIEKPVVEDWQNGSIEMYVYRCTGDTKINLRLWQRQLKYLEEIYSKDGVPQYNEIARIIDYLSYKMKCAREQEETKWRLDVELCKKNLATLEKEKEIRYETLRAAMPEHITYKIASFPKRGLKNKDGSYSVIGTKWLNLCREHNLPDHHVGAIKVVDKTEPGNPRSVPQIKDWLFSLGWTPLNYKDVKDKKNPQAPIRKVPQLSDKDKSEELCPSIKALVEKYPQLQLLEGLFMVNNRIDTLSGFLRNVNKDGYLMAQVKGLTNTLRFQHTTIVNLPTIPKPYWEEIRGCLIAPDDEHLLCGSDMSGLEDNTKQHYMFYFDPEYVKEMREYGFDPHIDIAILAKKMSRDEGTFYKWYTAKKEGKDYNRIFTEYMAKGLSYEERTRNNAIPTTYPTTVEVMIELPQEAQDKIIKLLKPIRLKCKKVNFAAVYGAGPPKLAITMGSPLAEGQELHGVYWFRNKAVKEVAAACIVKTIGSQMWLYNPVSKFWYTLRFMKDVFSTLNQGTGVYCFDLWNSKVRGKGWKLCGQFHDEIIAPIHKRQEVAISEALLQAIAETNNEVRLNVPLSVSKDFGRSYAEIH